jgi:DNA polymerase III delta subunit
LLKLIIINGDEEFLKELTALEEAESLADKVIKFDLESQTSEYEEDVSMPGFNNEKICYVLFGAKNVPELLPSGDNSAIIVSDKKIRLDDSRASKILEFKKLKSYDDNNEVIRWIIKEGNRLGIDLGNVANAIFIHCGDNLRKIYSEIKKLSVIAPLNKVITQDVARSILCFSADVSPRHVIDAICSGHTARALAFYDKLQEHGDETAWMLSYLQRHVLQQVYMEKLTSLKSSDIPGKLGVNPYIYKKVMTKNLGKWSVGSLIHSINTLCDLDVKHSKGDFLTHYGLELEIIRLSEEVRSGKQGGKQHGV